MVEQSAKPINLEAEIYQLIVGAGGKYEVVNGIVYAHMPDGRRWDFTEPKLIEQADK